MAAHYTITIPSQGLSFVTPHGSNLLQAIMLRGVPVIAPCGGLGTCGKCRFKVLRGEVSPGAPDRQIFTPQEIDGGWRLMCQTRVVADLDIEIPAFSLLASKSQILTLDSNEDQISLEPAVSKHYLEIPPPSGKDATADLTRLKKQLGAVTVDFNLLRQLPDLLRFYDFKGTAYLADGCFLDFEQGNTSDYLLGVAFDIGTTTLGGALLDLRTGQELALAARLNPQIKTGDDIMSRIHCARSSQASLKKMQQILLAELSSILDELCVAAGAIRENIYEITVAGNTAMQQIFCGISPRALGEMPFVPSHKQSLSFLAAEIGLSIAPKGKVYVFPAIGGFVGGDTVAGMLVSGFDKKQATTLMIDIGTNGELVLLHADKLYCTSTAAGPAFEGARLSSGMRASPGAVERVVFENQLKLSVIGGGVPSGICGSGLIDLIAELLRAGIVTPEGKILSPKDLPSNLPEDLARRVQVSEQGASEFVLVAQSVSTGEHKVALTQKDVREVQLGVGAVRAGVNALLKYAGIKTTDLKEVFLAGGFGNFIQSKNARRIGLLPKLATNKLTYLGNSSLRGARRVLLNASERKIAEKLAFSTRHFDLSTDPEFQSFFAEAMIFPSA